MNLRCWYHVYADGCWQAPLEEYLDALRESGYRPRPEDASVSFGLVGTAKNRRAVRSRLSDPGDHIAVEAKQGFEDVTLNAMLGWAQEHDGACLYAHTKGAHVNSSINANWRRSMTRRVIFNWRENLAALEDYQVVGCHWLTPEDYSQVTDGRFFGGNFWLARCDYLRTLGPCSSRDRYAAEVWIGTGNPKALDLLPGWPSTDTFTACG